METITHVYRDVGPRHVMFSVHGELPRVGRCDYHIADITVCTGTCTSQVAKIQKAQKKLKRQCSKSPVLVEIQNSVAGYSLMANVA